MLERPGALLGLLLSLVTTLAAEPPTPPPPPVPPVPPPAATAPANTAAPGSAAPGLAAPESAPPGLAAPESAAPGLAAPESAAPGLAAPESAAPGSETPGFPTPDDTTTTAFVPATRPPGAPGPVEVPEQRGEAVTVFRHPNGARTLVLSAGPVRLRRGEHWQPVDLTLHRDPDGGVRPVAHPDVLWLSGGGHPADAAAVRGPDGTNTALAWDAPLPAPRLDGSRAIYPNARPGADLVITATRTGFVATLEATGPAPHPAPRTAPAPPSTAPRPGPLPAPEDAPPAGQTTPQAAPPVASAQPAAPSAAPTRAAAPAAEAPPAAPAVPVDPPPAAPADTPPPAAASPQAASANTARPAPAGASHPTAPADASHPAPPADASHPAPPGPSGAPAADGPTAQPLTLRVTHPDQAHLGMATGGAAPAALTAPPVTAAGAIAGPPAPPASRTVLSRVVAAAHPGGTLPYATSVENTSPDADMSGEPDVKLGSYDGSTVARGFLSWDLSRLRGQHVVAATLRLYSTWSASCERTGWEVWSSAPVGAATRWTNQPAGERAWATSTDTKGHDAHCRPGWTSVDLTELVRSWVQAGSSTGTVLLRATNEQDRLSWKRFSSGAGPFVPALGVTVAP